MADALGLIETKGWEDAEVSRKDAHAEWWCAQISKQTGTAWKYAKVPYRMFHSAQLKSFAGLVAALAPQAAQLRHHQDTDGRAVPCVEWRPGNPA